MERRTSRDADEPEPEEDSDVAVSNEEKEEVESTTVVGIGRVVAGSGTRSGTLFEETSEKESSLEGGETPDSTAFEVPIIGLNAAPLSKLRFKVLLTGARYGFEVDVEASDEVVEEMVTAGVSGVA